MSKQAHAHVRGEVSSVQCPCGWHGLRQRSSTQPCPACDEPLDWLPAVRKAAEYQREAEKKRRKRNRDSVEAVRQANLQKQAEEAFELEVITALLRRHREDAQR